MRPAYLKHDQHAGQFEAGYPDGTVIRSPSLSALETVLETLEQRTLQEQHAERKPFTQKQADAWATVAGCTVACAVIALTAAAVALWN